MPRSIKTIDSTLKTNRMKFNLKSYIIITLLGLAAVAVWKRIWWLLGVVVAAFGYWFWWSEYGEKTSDER